jgi:hypothetical protein
MDQRARCAFEFTSNWSRIESIESINPPPFTEDDEQAAVMPSLFLARNFGTGISYNAQINRFLLSTHH